MQHQRNTPIEDYAVIGNTRTACLVSRRGSIDWFCTPRFDSGACFAALLGDASHGRWLIAPVDESATVSRSYRSDSLVLDTEWETREGQARIVDLMPPHRDGCEVVRIIEGISGRVRLAMELTVRFDYGSIVPWVRQTDGGLALVGGPDALILRSPVPTRGAGLTTVAEFEIGAGESLAFVLAWHPSYETPPHPHPPQVTLKRTLQWWRHWVHSGTLYSNPEVPERWRQAGVRSLITLKALTYEPTGGIVAAPTTSLPEQLGGARNWDYRACWLRDSTFTLLALAQAGHGDEARAWFTWLLRAAAGDASRLQIMYGPAGERRLTETELPWLPGYADSSPVRIGNRASEQFQLDVWGEVLDSFHQVQRTGITVDQTSWQLATTLIEFVERHWSEPDYGIWEVRGPRQHFTHSKVMAWVALDRAVKSVEMFGHHGPVDRWQEVREAIHRDVCTYGFAKDRGTFTQTYGGTALDASLLMIPLVGFLPADDERVQGTATAIAEDLREPSGLIRRYDTSKTDDGLDGSEGYFLACTCWMVDYLVLAGRAVEASALLERVLDLANDVGLLAEEYDVATHHMLGNFPQAFSHVAIVNSIHNLSLATGPAVRRATT